MGFKAQKRLEDLQIIKEGGGPRSKLPHAKAVLMDIARTCTDPGKGEEWVDDLHSSCYLSKKRMEKHLCLAKSTVKAAIADLTRAGLLVGIRQSDEGTGRDLSNHYRIEFPDVTKIEVPLKSKTKGEGAADAPGRTTPPVVPRPRSADAPSGVGTRPPGGRQTTPRGGVTRPPYNLKNNQQNNRQANQEDAPLRHLDDVTAEEERRAKAQDPGPLFTKPEQVGYTPPTFTPDVIPEKGPPPPPDPDAPLQILQYFQEQIGEALPDNTREFAEQLRCVEDRLKGGFTPDQLRTAAHGAATSQNRWRQPECALGSRKSTLFAIDKAAPKKQQQEHYTLENDGWGPRKEGW